MISTPSECPLVRASDNAVWIEGHHDTLAAPIAYPTTSVVTLSLFTGAGLPVPEVQNMAMPHVAGTAGAGTTYRCIVPFTVPLLKQRYTGKILAVDGGSRRTYTISCPVIDTA